ncbi:MAG: GNAT family N-acetyltransferase, partial [Candidatus Omnitrophota bacterium]
MDLEVKVFDPKTGIEQQRRLFKACFPETIGTVLEKDYYYDWKFHQASDNKALSYEYGAYFDGKLVGYYGWVPVPYNIEGKETREVIACDAMIDSSFRKKGIFSKLGFYSLEQLKSNKIDFTVGYALRPEVIPGHLKVGWKIAFDLPFYAKILDSQSVLKAKKIAFLTPIANILFKIY